MKTATIPMPGDLAELIGPAAQKVENRSLLLDKFAFHKKWPEASDSRGPIKWDAASRWSFLRIADGASQLLKKEAKSKRREADGRNTEPQNAERFKAEAEIAESLSAVAWNDKELSELRVHHTQRLLSLLRTAYGTRAVVEVGQLEARLAIHLASSLIPNAGICLDRIFGLPYIPGSSIKGVCRHAALEEIRNSPNDHELVTAFCTVFGTAENDFINGDLSEFQSLLHANAPLNRKGCVSFLPAYPANEAKIAVDLTTVHFPDYYRSGREEDLSQESPKPNPFPVVESGTQFAFCLVLTDPAQDQSILTHARRWLHTALTVRGLGAKTASGYGWFSLKEEVGQKLLDAADREKLQRAEQKAAASLEPDPALLETLRAMKPDAVAGILNKYAYDRKFWPPDSTLVYEVSLFEFVKTAAPQLVETKNGKKAMNLLAEKLNRSLS